MFRYFKQLAGDSLIYGVSSVISGFISFFLVPVYTNIFPPADYGVINLVNTTFFLLNIFVVFGLDNSVAVWFWDKTETDERKKTFATWFWFQLVVSIIFCLLIALLSASMSKVILASSSYYLIFIIAAFNLPLVATHRILINWYKYQRKPVATVAFTLTVSLSFILLSILFVVYMRIGVKGVFYAQIISSFVGAVFVLFRMRNWFKISFFNKERLKEMLAFAAPLVPASLMFWILSSAGSYFIQHYSSQTEVGLYQVALTFAGLVNIIIIAFNNAWPPFALSISKQPDHKRVYANVFLFYVSIGSVAATALWVFSPDLLRALTNSKYYNAADIMGILAYNVFIAGIANITTIGCNLVKTNKPYAQAVFIASMISILLYFLLVPRLGKEGAGCATLAGSVCLVIYVSYKANKLYPVPYNWSKGLLFIISGAAVVYLARYFFSPLTKHFLLLKIAIFLGYLIFLGILNRELIKKIMSYRLATQRN